MTRSYRSHHLLLKTLAGTALARTVGSLGRRLAGIRMRLDRAAVIPASDPDTFVLVVDDPDGTMRLIAVDGPMHHDAVTQIDGAVSGIGPGTALHLDLNAVTTWPSETLTALEQVFDRVESSGARLRVIGIDPRLPALPRPRGS